MEYNNISKDLNSQPSTIALSFWFNSFLDIVLKANEMKNYRFESHIPFLPSKTRAKIGKFFESPTQFQKKLIFF